MAPVAAFGLAMALAAAPAARGAEDNIRASAGAGNVGQSAAVGAGKVAGPIPRKAGELAGTAANAAGTVAKKTLDATSRFLKSIF